MSVSDTALDSAVATGYFECSLCEQTRHTSGGVEVTRMYNFVDWEVIAVSESIANLSVSMTRHMVMSETEDGRCLIGSDHLETKDEYLARIKNLPSWRVRSYTRREDRDIVVCTDCFAGASDCFVNNSDCVPRIASVEDYTFNGFTEIPVDEREAFLIDRIVEAYDGSKMSWSRVGLRNDARELVSTYLRHIAWAENNFEGFPIDYAEDPHSFEVSSDQMRKALTMRGVDVVEFVRNATYALSASGYNPENQNGCISHHDWMECGRCETAGHEDEYTWVVDAWDGESWCESCRDNYACYCDHCDQYETGDFCDANFESSEATVIHNYSWSPNPLNFWYVDRHGDLDFSSVNGGRETLAPSSTLYMGFELEMEMRDYNVNRVEIAEHLLADWPTDSIYFKHDASLNCGIEMVTHPMTLEAFKQMPFEGLDELGKKGVRSWNTSTCGMHIHLSRRAFRGSTHIWAFSQLVAQNSAEMIAIAGRNSERFGNLDTESMVEGLREHLKGSYSARYNAINYQNRYTLELRMFKGSLRHQRVLANLEFAHAAHAYSSRLTANSIIAGAKSMKEAARAGALSWSKFAEFIQNNADTYQNLIAILEEKSLLTVENGAN